MKRVIIFSTAYLPWQGGAELAVKEITNRINDFEFDLICARLKPDLAKEEKIGNVMVYRIGWGMSFDKILLPLFGFWKAKRIYRKNSSLITHHSSLILWGVMASWGSAAAWLFKILNPAVPFLLTLQEGDVETHIRTGRFGLINLGWRLMLKKANYVQVISRYLAEMAKKYGYKGAIEVVPNGVTPTNYEFERITNKRDELKKKLNIREGERIIITISRLVEKNGIEDLIEAMNRLQLTDCRPPFKLLILGSGALKKKLEDSVKRLEIQDKVMFLGEVANEEVPKYLAIADVFVRPSLSEGLGTAFLEAMAAGVPIIGTPVGGIPDFLTDKETGLFCEVRNPKSIADKINLLFSDENLRQKLIANGRRLIEEKYQWDKIAEKMGDIFDKLVLR